MIAVIGATGNTGRATVKELQALGEDPLCVVRDAEKARKVLAPGSRTAIAEITDRAALEQALRGVKSVFVVTGHNPQTGPQQINILEAAKAAGVEFIAKVSGGRALVSPDSTSVVGRGHYEIEEAIRSSGLDLRSHSSRPSSEILPTHGATICSTSGMSPIFLAT